MKKVFFIFFLLNFINSYDPKFPLLQDDFKSDVEYIFEKGQNFSQIFDNEDSIRKYFHFFKENEINLNTGARFKCFVPNKIKVDYSDNNYKGIEKINVIPEDLIGQIMRIPSNTCYTLNVKEWYYKLCPLRLTQQTLAYSKKNDLGEDYVEKFVLGFNRNLTQLSPFEIFLNDNTTNLNKLIINNLTHNPFLMTEGNIAKIHNYDMGSIADYESNLAVLYDLSDFDLSKEGHLRVNQFKTLNEYINDHPEKTEIPFERKIIRIIGKNTILLSSSFPYPKIQYEVIINPIKQKISKENEQSFNIYIFKEFIYCAKCEFLTHYNIGDTFMMKNSKFTENQIDSFRGKSFQGRVITEIINNNLLKVHKPFDKLFQISTFRSNYLVVDSFGKRFRWNCGTGYIKHYKNLIFGSKTNFLKEVQPGDRIYFVNIQRLKAYYHHTTTNPKLDEQKFCVVKKVLNRFLLITDNSCIDSNGFKGVYFISKFLDKKSSIEDETKIKDYSSLKDLRNEENIKKIANARKDLYRLTLNFNKLNYIKPNKEEHVSKIEIVAPQNRSSIFGLYDFDLFEEIGFNRISNVFYSHQYISHKGLMLKRPDNSVLRMKLLKTDSSFGFLRLIFSTNLEDFISNKINEQTDYELIIHSENGIALRKINNNGIANKDSFQFIDMDIRSFFHETTNIDIVFLNKTIYINSNDDDFDSSIKIHIDVPENIRFISFDSMKSTHIEVKELRLMNIVDNTLMHKIYVYEKTHLLGDNATYIEEQNNGDHCDDVNTNRTSVIEYKCDKTGNYDIIIDKVEEISTCRYKYHARSRFLCNPYNVMKQRILNSIAKTKCYVKNNFFYANSKELVNKLV